MQNNALKISRMTDIWKEFLDILSSIFPWWRQPEPVQLKEPDFLPTKWMTVYNHLFLNSTEESENSDGKAIKKLGLSQPIHNWAHLPDPPESWVEGQFGNDRDVAVKQMFLLLSLWKKICEADKSMEKIRAQFTGVVNGCLNAYNEITKEYDKKCTELFLAIEGRIKSANTHQRSIEDIGAQIKESEFKLRKNENNKLRKIKIIGTLFSFYFDFLLEKSWQNHRSLVNKLNSHLQKIRKEMIENKRLTTDEGIKSITKKLREKGDSAFQ